MNLPDKIDRAFAENVCRNLGVELSDVSAVSLDRRGVTVDVFHRDEHGNKTVFGNERATDTYRIPWADEYAPRTTVFARQTA